MKFAIYLTNPDIGEFSFTEEHARYLVERLPVASLSVCATEAEFLDALEDANVALVWRFEQAWFARASRLKLISTPAAGRDYFQITPPPTVRVIYGSFHGLIMGETAVAWVLGAARGVLASAREMREIGRAHV